VDWGLYMIGVCLRRFELVCYDELPSLSYSYDAGVVGSSMWAFTIFYSALM